MSCGCKNVRDTSVSDAKLMNHNKNIEAGLLGKWLIFIGITILSPLFVPFLIYFFYKLIIKTENFDATFMLKGAVKLIKTYMIVNKDFDVDSVDLEVYDENKEFELVNV
jgi:hypothetical protein